MVGVYRFKWDCGRGGEVEGLFTADSQEVESILGENVYFGEILGKHSEVYGVIEEGDIQLVTEDPIAVHIFIEHGFESGYNPFNYLPENDEEDDFEEDEEEEPSIRFVEGDECRVCGMGNYRILSLNDDFAGKLTCQHCKDTVYLNRDY